MNSIAKGAIGLGGVGTATGEGILANHLINSKEERNLSSKLKEDKFILLNLDVSKQESDDSKWQTIFTSYEALTTDKANLKIGNLTLTSGDKNAGIKQLKEACSSLLNTQPESSDFDKNYQLASQWCVEPISVESILQKRGITYLDTTGSENSKEWGEIAKEYEKIQTEAKKPLSEVTWTQVTSNNYSANITAIKEACKKRKEKSSHQEGFSDALKEAQSWCSITSKNR
ncbi:hypothetical protein HF1_13430 [Mycoplasma haemofelis str. Langford 1]|uniref:Uncharacterized protein n=1 Tax=Mycoplasma haemofelis (strain Langford 1) TaxID=941640 RepID=E8ZJN0_MYCHL|nr:hypothetical protein [Mycoplasma haemofelis]CBY93351.1 hypothetical protein HF1_13430 [Mycoplasma haemofelis str. Langford 1]